MRRVLVLLQVFLLAACGGADRPAAEQATPAGTPSAPGPALTSTSSSGGLACMDDVDNVDLAVWGDTLTATRKLRITAATAVGHGVRAAGGLLVPVVGGSVHSAGIATWPPKADRVLKADVDWAAREPILGAALPVQRAMLSMLRVHAVGGAELEAVELAYETDDGYSGTLRLPMKVRFSRTTC